MVTLMKKLLSDGAGFHNILCYCCEVFLSTIHRILDLQCFSIYRVVTIDLKSKVLRLFQCKFDVLFLITQAKIE